jgi:hypothetical protein
LGVAGPSAPREEGDDERRHDDQPHDQLDRAVAHAPAQTHEPEREQDHHDERDREDLPAPGHVPENA